MTGSDVTRRDLHRLAIAKAVEHPGVLAYGVAAVFISSDFVFADRHWNPPRTGGLVSSCAEAITHRTWD